MNKGGRVVFITQARTSSTRLPGKVMKKVNGQTVLFWFLKRAQRCKTPSLICVATTQNSSDDVIVDHVRNNFSDIHITRGSEQDVLSRYALAAQETNADIIIRVTSDCPFFDWDLVDRCVNILIDKNADAARTDRDGFPIGLDVEVFSRNALVIADREAKNPFEREHVGPFIFGSHASQFYIERIKNDGLQWPECRLTLDYPEDMLFINDVFKVVDPLAKTENFRLFLKNNADVVQKNLMYLR